MDKPASDLETCIEGMVKGNTITTLRSEECQEIIKATVNRLLPAQLRKSLTTEFLERTVKAYLTSDDGKALMEALIQDVLVVGIKDAVTNDQLQPLLQQLTPKVLDQILASEQLRGHVTKSANDTADGSVLTKILPHLHREQGLNLPAFEQRFPVPTQHVKDEKTRDPRRVAKASTTDTAQKSAPTNQLRDTIAIVPHSDAEAMDHPVEPRVAPKKSLGASLFGPLTDGSKRHTTLVAANEQPVDDPSTPGDVGQAAKMPPQGTPKDTVSAKSKAKSNSSGKVDQSGPSEIGTKRSAKRNAGDGDSVASEDNPSPAKKTRIRKPPPGHATGADIKFSIQGAPRLSGAKKPCGKPRLINVDEFAPDTNMAHSNMQDVVATILWNHDPESIKGLLENDRPRYHYLVYDTEDRQKNFAVYKVKGGEGAEIHVSRWRR